MTRPLFPIDPHLFADDLVKLQSILEPHEKDDKEYSESGPFREVRTAWINRVDIYPPYHALRANNFLISRHVLNKIAQQIKNENARLARSYYCTIDPGRQIYPHVDTKFEYFNLINRYQIMFDIPPGCVIEQEQSEYLPNHVHHFDLETKHAFRNEGTDQWAFIVFDIFN